MNQERFDYLLQRFKADMLSESEEQEWQEMVASGAYQSAIDADIDRLLAHPLSHPPRDADPQRHIDPLADPRWNAGLANEAWKNILTTTRVSPPASVPRPATVSPPATVKWLRPVPLIAAACIFLLAVGIWLLRRPAARIESRDRELTVAAGTQTRLSLSDGTTVLLNAGSFIRYPTAFAGPYRDIELRGQAYIKAAPDSKAPFRVLTAHQTVEVLGTRFLIDAYPGEPETKTTLLTGSVRIIAPTDSLILRPGQMAVSDSTARSIRVSVVDTAQLLAWKNNDFSFHQLPLPEAMHQLERWYGVQITCSSAADTLRVTGYISRQRSLADVLKMLAFTNGINYVITGQHVEIGVPSR